MLEGALTCALLLHARFLTSQSLPLCLLGGASGGLRSWMSPAWRRLWQGNGLACIGKQGCVLLMQFSYRKVQACIISSIQRIMTA